jgi:hypothetical protein
MDSPPQNCSKIVFLMSIFMGSCNFRASFIKKVPTFTSHPWFINAKSQYVFRSLKFDWEEKAIDVSSKDNGWAAFTGAAVAGWTGDVIRLLRFDIVNAPFPVRSPYGRSVA